MLGGLSSFCFSCFLNEYDKKKKKIRVLIIIISLKSTFLCHNFLVFLVLLKRTEKNQLPQLF